MKKVFILIAFLMLVASVFAQAPQKMSYQAVIRNSSDALVVNTQIGMQISILQGSANGAAVYVETQRPSTNANGLVSIEIGAGYVESGSFTNIDWQNGPYFIKTETDPEGRDNYSITGTSQILSVPFALHAKTAESANETDPDFNAWDKSSGISISESQISDLNHFTNDDENDPVFSAWDKSSGIAIAESQISDLNHFTNDDETDPVFGVSPAASITEADKERWNNKKEFSGSYADLSDKPENLSDFTNDAGYQLRSEDEDEDTDSENEIQHLFTKSNHRIGLTGSDLFVDINSLENDPVFGAWNKSAGISITESQITDLDHFTTADETDPVYNVSQAKKITNAGSGQVITTVERNKLNGIEAGGEVNVQSDWDQTDIYADDYIKNKIDTLSLSNRIQNNRQGIIDSTASLRISIGQNTQGIVDSTASLSNRIQNNSQGIIDSTAAIRNSMTSNIHDDDNDTKIQTEESSDEDIIRFDIAGNEVMTIDGSSGTTMKLPTNDNTSSINITKNNGTSVFKVDGSGHMSGDGSGLSNVRPKLAYAQGNQSVYFHEGLIPGLNLYEAQIMREVTIACPGPGQIVARASGYADWESKNEDLVRIWFWPHPTVSPTDSWQTPDFHNLVILSDYQCADSSDQYTSWSIQKVYEIPSAQNYTVRICADKPFTSSKVLIGDCSLQLMFFPTGGTGGASPMPFMVSNDALDNKQEFDFVPESVDGSSMQGRSVEKDISNEEKISVLENRIKRLEELLQYTTE